MNPAPGFRKYPDHHVEAAPAKERVRVTFDTAQAAITPGQAAVFFDGDRVVGGGWIQAVED